MKLSRKKPSTADLPRRRTQASSSQRAEAPHQFRRGRTITGSSSANISSGNELRADILSPRAQSHHLSAHRRKLGWRLLAIVIVCLAIYVLLGQLIAEVTVRSSVTVSRSARDSYVATLDTYLSRHPVERFKPSLNTRSMNQFLQASHPELLDSDIQLTSNFGKAQLSVRLRKPIARWTINGSNEYVDSTGTVFNYNAYPSDIVQIVDNNGAAAPQSGIVASQRFLSFVGLVVGDMQDRGYSVTKATIPPLTTRQLSLNVKKIPYTFTLSTDRSAGEQSEDISRIITYLRKKGITPSYVDVRLKGKAFYK